MDRRITLRLYPNMAQHAMMAEVRARVAELYNAALQERRDAWKKQKISISYFDQCRSLTIIRAEHPEHRALMQGCQEMTLHRLDRAFQAFFRRVKRGQTPGFPKFKSHVRFRGWSLRKDKGYKYKPKVTVDGRWFNGVLHLSGIGAIKARGRARNVAGRIKQVDIMWRQERWYASLVVECTPERQRGTRFVGMDWGVNDYATLAYADGETETIANDRLFKAQQEKAVARQRAASKSLRGKRSRRAAAKHLKIGRVHAKLAAQRKDRCHKATAKLVASCRFIATEKLQVVNMTRSAKGTVDQPGKNVAQKAGLNREILDTAPGLLTRQLRAKAEEAGCVFVEINTRRHKPSQTCPQCNAVVKKTLDERQHRCGCGYEATRDGAAALVILMRALDDYGRKPSCAQIAGGEAGGDAPENCTQNGSAVWVE